MAYKIILDAGHGGADPGAVYEGRQEKNDNLNLVYDIGFFLENAGVDVVYTRVSDVYNTPYEKAMMGNNSGADYFISIHRNAMDIPQSASGIESLIYSRGGPAELMADNINTQLEKAGYINLGITERPNLVVLNSTGIPAVLVEVGFIDNPADNMLLDMKSAETAKAIADGIIMTLEEEADAKPKYYQVQVGEFINKENADRLYRRLLAEGFPVFIIAEDGRYKVRVGAYLNVDNAAAEEKRLRNRGYNTFMVYR